MTLISCNPTNEKLYCSPKNLRAILSLGENPKKEEFLTRVALDCLDEIKKSQLGLGHSIKKFFATTLTYASVMAAPIVALTGMFWRYKTQIAATTIAPSAIPAVGAAIVANWAVKKTCNISPMTAISLAAIDSYRHGAKALSNQVRDRYTAHEDHLKRLIQADHETIQKELSEVMNGIAGKLVAWEKMKKLGDLIPRLEQKLPALRTSFSQIGLSKVEISKILSPLEDTMRLLKATNKPPITATNSAG